MPKYDKLVRDKIPDILVAQKLRYSMRVVDGPLLKHYMRQKLQEEVNEFIGEPSLEELGDIQEVITGLLNVHGWKQEDLDAQVLLKRLERGSFSKGLVLEEVIS